MAKTKILQYKVIIERDENGMYLASVPELPACYTQAKTLEILRKRIKEAIKLVLREDRELIKEKSSLSPSFFGIEEITVRYA